MKSFARLYRDLEHSSGTLDKRAHIARYAGLTPQDDLAWALWLLSGGKIGRIANGRELREWISEESGELVWLVEECYSHVGDLAETLTLLLREPPPVPNDRPLRFWIEEVLLPVAGQAPELRREVVTSAWRTLPRGERLVFNKLITGALRIGVSTRLVQQALADYSGVPLALLAQRMLGSWQPSAEFVGNLFSPDEVPGDREQPYPFFLASPIPGQPQELGAIEDWLLEWKWDGIRVQVIRRGGDVALWSRGEERLDGRFPEIEAAATSLGEDAVFDGELLAWQDGDAPLPFTALQTRIQRRKPSARHLATTPARVIVYDLLEHRGEDLRALPLSERRARLQALLERHPEPRLSLSREVDATGWEEAAALRESARERGVEGLMIKRRDSPYQVGRRRGDWWKWKVDPLSIDAVLLYAQAGHGRRSTLYTDYTFGLWTDEGILVPVAKAYSGLDDKEILKLDQWIRTHTLERFGPVRSVTPELVFELGFEGVNLSTRHKSGVAVRFPRILRWRHDKPAAQADRLATLKALAG